MVVGKPASDDQLQGESGVSGPSELPSVDHKKLFRPNLIVEFGEDSPAFRRKVDALDRNVEGEKLTRTLLFAKFSDENDWTKAVEIALEG